MPTKAELEAKLAYQERFMNDLKKHKDILNKEMVNQANKINSLIGDCSDLRDKISDLNKRNREIIAENTLLKAQLRDANQALYKTINKL